MVVAATLLAAPPLIFGQGRGNAAAAANRTPKERAPIDLTGQWIPVITEDWRYRMVTPTKGDYQGVPMNPEARKVADAWNPEADQSAGLACKSYGAPALLRVPGRFRFTWQDDKTLKMDADTGTQTRVFRFDPPAGKKAAASWQGDSVAAWEQLAAGFQGAAAPPGGWLKVTTTNLKSGYLRKNGVPYSENTKMTEYFDIGTMPNGERLLVVTAMIEDPKYLTQPFIISTHFKKQADESGWEPTPCSSVW
jgi:hypothetical protein